jgi:hypothetical protein
MDKRECANVLREITPDLIERLELHGFQLEEGELADDVEAAATAADAGDEVAAAAAMKEVRAALAGFDADLDYGWHHVAGYEDIGIFLAMEGALHAAIELAHGRWPSPRFAHEG